MLNQQAFIDELNRRLVSAEYEEIPANEVIESYRAELKQQRAQEARRIAEFSANATYRVARIERLDRGQGLMPIDRIAEIITVLQSELPALCKANGINKDELISALNHQRKETRGSNGTRWQAYPLLFSEASEQGHREAREEWELETKREEQYLANRKKNGQMGYKPLPEPVHSTFKGLR